MLCQIRVLNLLKNLGLIPFQVEWFRSYKPVLMDIITPYSSPSEAVFEIHTSSLFDHSLFF